MTQIEQPTCALTEAIKPLLPTLLVQVADHRVLEGFRKYGQTLSDNHKPLRKKVVHHIQELLDALNYNEWELQDLTRHADHIPLMFEAMARRRTYIRHLFELLALVPDLTFDELTHKEGHSEADQLRADLAAAQARVTELETENAAKTEALARAGQADRLIREWFTETVGVEKAEGEYRQDQSLGDALTQAHTRKLRAEIKLATYAAPSTAAKFGLTESNVDAATGAQP